MLSLEFFFILRVRAEYVHLAKNKRSKLELLLLKDYMSTAGVVRIYTA